MNDYQELDRLILSLAKPDWQKTAMIIAKALHHFETVVSDESTETVAKRINHLVGRKQLEARGDLSKWRFSEVRLPPSSG